MARSGRPNTLKLPSLLKTLIEQNRWRQPSDELIASTIPFLRDPVDFLLTESRMRSESSGFLADDERMGSLFHEYRGSVSEPRSLPWLDVDKALMIAVNRELGVDIAIALDYRANAIDPSVVATEWVEESSRSFWREVFPSFETFVRHFKL
jgi:hypothetical protein